MEKERLWTKDYILLCTMNLFFSIIFFLLMVTVSVYAVEAFGASEGQAGLVAGIFVIGVLIGRLFSGKIVENVSIKKLLYVGAILYILTTGLYFFANSLSALLTVRLLHGIAFGFIGNCNGTMIAHTIPSSRRGEGIGYFGSFMILGTAIGPFIGIYLTNITGYSAIYTISFVLSIFPFLMSFFVKAPVIESSPTPARNHDDKQKRFQIKLSDFIEMRVLPISFVMAIIAVAYSSILSFLSFYAKEINLVEASSLFFLVYSMAILVSRPITGKLIDKMGENIVVYPALLLFAGGMFFLSQVQHGWALIMAAVIIGLGYGNFFSTAQTISIKVIPPQQFGKATATFFIMLEMGVGFGPYIVGSFVPMLGYRNVYMTMGFVILIGLVLYYFIHGKKQRVKQRTQEDCLVNVKEGMLKSKKQGML